MLHYDGRLPTRWIHDALQTDMQIDTGIQMDYLRGRVMATFSRRGSATKPRRLSWLQRTVLKTITSASRPWYASTDEMTTESK